MSEYIYKLNLPDLKDIVIKDQFYKILISEAFHKTGHMIIPAEKFLNSNHLMINGIYFNEVSIFLKNDQTGSIHADDLNEIRDESAPAIWGINWTFNGTGIMEYWKKDQINLIEKIKDRAGTYNMKCNVSSPPCKIYNMENKSCYLVNASVPHRATGNGKRYVFSLRSKASNLPWNKIVEQFNHLILK